MSTQSQIIQNPALPPLEAPEFDIATRLQECSSRLRDFVRGAAVSIWLKENHTFLQAQIADLRQILRPAFLRKLGHTAQGEPRIYRIATELLGNTLGVLDCDALMPMAEALRQEESLETSDLWAFGPMVKLALVERLCANLDSERLVITCIKSMWAIQAMYWPGFVERASRIEAALAEDPAGVYARMDVTTRQRYRTELKRLSVGAGRREEDVARAAVECAEQAIAEGNPDSRSHHVGYYLVGDGARAFRRSLHCKLSIGLMVSDLAKLCPNVLYAFGVATLMGLVILGFAWVAGPVPFPKAWWLLGLLLIPASQAALEIANGGISRLLDPRFIPAMDFLNGIPDDCKTMVVIPTLLFSPANCTKLLKDLEIRYLANRDRNLFFGLLTDFPDADQPEIEADHVLKQCVDGIAQLNERYGPPDHGPFYLFHRPRRWNPQQGKWMGYERKRGKLNDLNRLLRGRGNWFDTIVGEMGRLIEIRYVITLDTDTQLPRDSAAKMIGAMAHPLNRPILNPVTRTVEEGYALLRPQVAISVESAQRSWIARIFSGQPGFDPYGVSVSDVYHDLHGQASFTGKGIYDVHAFDDAVGDRFPENAILSHDLIEGEHARTGLIAVELVEDYPATYGAFSKRKHRWVRGDWQLLPWLFRHPPVSGGRAKRNPLSAISRWKVIDNLRRSLVEVSLLLLLVAGWFLSAHQARWTIAVLLLLQVPAYVDMLLSFVQIPERKHWKSFGRMLGQRFIGSHRDTFLTLVFIPHQACLMVDAIGRTLWRLYVSHSNMLQWETMAQSEMVGGARLSLLDIYLYAASIVWLPFLFLAGPLPILVPLVCAFWITSPMIAAWLNEPVPKPAGVMKPKDRDFLRETALRTWRYFADHCVEEDHWLVPDNVQHDPPIVTHQISPTNLGLSLTAHLAAHDFGYLNMSELATSVERIFHSLEEMPRYRGHFFNWYNTQTRTPLNPRYVSSVDSGNLAASLAALRQGCLMLLDEPIIGQGTLDGIRDHVLRLRDEVPYDSRTFTTMRVFGSLLKLLDCQPRDLFFWEGLLTESRELVERIRTILVHVHARTGSTELRYWEDLLGQRIDAALRQLYELAPWLAPPFEPELRVNMRDETLTPLMAELSRIPKLGQLPETYERIRGLIDERFSSQRPVYPMLREALEQLRRKLSSSRAAAIEISRRFQSIAAISKRYFDDMDFGFLFDENRQLLCIGYNLEAERPDQSYYDLLASEARSAVFLAIAKGDIPRETWMRLGRKLTAYRDQVTLLAWSGTMFEYLMPQLHLRSYPGTLIDRSLRAAVRIQRIYGEEHKVPWGISEAAYADRDQAGRYQYRAFGVPPLSGSGGEEQQRLVIAPYASMLAVMLDPVPAIANLRTMAANGWMKRHGFVESIDYTNGSAEVVHCFMAHHQGMALLAINNALLGNPMQERFHHDPLVQSTEFLLEERMPTLLDLTPVKVEAAA